MDSSLRPPPSPPKDEPPPRPMHPQMCPPSPPRDEPPPRPLPKPLRTTRTESGSSEGSNPPSYFPRIPPPFMSGYMEKGSGEPISKSQMWSRKYVEVSQGELRFYNSRDERGDELAGVAVSLVDAFVSIQDKRIIRLESKTGTRLFRTSSETRALKWICVISRYCTIPPSAEGYCKKLSGGKHILQDRYLKLTADGIVSWYEKEEDNKCKGSIQVRGETTSLDMDDRSILYVHTKERRYLFKFMDERESNLWLSSMFWHTSRPPLENPSANVRNK